MERVATAFLERFSFSTQTVSQGSRLKRGIAPDLQILERRRRKLGHLNRGRCAVAIAYLVLTLLQ